MKAVFHTGVPAGWGDTLGDRPWCLAPVGGKPLIEYWLEWAFDIGAVDVRIVLGDGADEVEEFCGDGSRWGLHADFSFLRNTSAPDDYLRRSPEQWTDGLLYICGPVFPRRLRPPPWAKPAEGVTLRVVDAGQTACLLSRDTRALRAFLSGAPPQSNGSWADLQLDPMTLRDVKSYYDLNMCLVGGELSHYVPPGYLNGDGASIGYNVMIPLSVELRPPLVIGNDCRIHSMAVVGPNAVIGNHVIVDRQTELSDCVVIDGTYLGRNLEISGKIVSGSRVVSPDDGSVVELSEPWLLARLESESRSNDLLRALVGWAVAVGLMLAQAIPFVLLYPLIRIYSIGSYRLSSRIGLGGRVRRLPVWTTLNSQSRLGRCFVGLGLDLFPLIALAAFGRIWLCGHAPLHPERDQALRKRLHRYFPAAIGYHTRRAEAGGHAVETTNALYYERYRSPAEDLRTVVRTLAGRFLDALSGESATAC